MCGFRDDSMIERGLLLSYRADPEVVSRLLPAPLRPRLRHGYAVAGIGLLRLRRIGLAGLPAGFGLHSENASHRFAVEWDTPDGPRSGGYVLSRDSASRLPGATRLPDVTRLPGVTWLPGAGGRLFPDGLVSGARRRAEFDVAEQPDRLRVAYASHDGATAVDVEVRIAGELPYSRLFDDTEQACGFARQGGADYPPERGDHPRARAGIGHPSGHARGEPGGLNFDSGRWRADPCVVDRAASSCYDDRSVFPAGSIELDSAVVLRRVRTGWTALLPPRAVPFPTRSGRATRAPAADDRATAPVR